MFTEISMRVLKERAASDALNQSEDSEFFSSRTADPIPSRLYLIFIFDEHSVHVVIDDAESPTPTEAVDV
jgi:hypothetical protein